MNMLSRALRALRVLTGLEDTSDSHLTPGHGWLLPDPVEARRGQEARDATRAQRAAARKARA